MTPTDLDDLLRLLEDALRAREAARRADDRLTAAVQSLPEISGTGTVSVSESKA